jgi:hypothetical protein
MKIVCVSHYRCSEFEHSRYYVCPPELTDEQIAAAVDAAQKSYLAAKKALDEANPLPKRPETDVRSSKEPDTTTLGQLRAAVGEYDKQFEARAELEVAECNSFRHHLEALGFVNLYEYDGPEVLRVEADWGHRHGQNLVY